MYLAACLERVLAQFRWSLVLAIMLMTCSCFFYANHEDFELLVVSRKLTWFSAFTLCFSEYFQSFAVVWSTILSSTWLMSLSQALNNCCSRLHLDFHLPLNLLSSTMDYISRGRPPLRNSLPDLATQRISFHLCVPTIPFSSLLVDSSMLQKYFCEKTFSKILYSEFLLSILSEQTFKTNIFRSTLAR